MNDQTPTQWMPRIAPPEWRQPPSPPSGWQPAVEVAVLLVLLAMAAAPIYFAWRYRPRLAKMSGDGAVLGIATSLRIYRRIAKRLRTLLERAERRLADK